MDELRDGLGEGLAAAATFVPKFIGFLLILVIGYFVAKAVEKVVDGLLERVGFDKYVERGGVRKALANSKFDASSILAKLAFYVLFLFVLQLAFGIFGSNPISDLISGVIAYLPNVFVAIVILVVGAAIAAGAKEIVEASLGGLSYGKALAAVASMAILVLAFFAAADQLQIAPTIVNTLFIGLVVLIVGSGIVAIGGGGIQTMSRYWERASQRVEQESTNVKQQAQGSSDRIQERAEQRKEQLQPSDARTGDTADLGTSSYGTTGTTGGSTGSTGTTGSTGGSAGTIR